MAGIFLTHTNQEVLFNIESIAKMLHIDTACMAIFFISIFPNFQIYTFGPRDWTRSRRCFALGALIIPELK